MAEKLERKVMEIYGENAATRDIIAYGSDIAGNIVETKDPDVIQTEAYKTGVRSAVVGNNSTTLQNRQALDFLFSRQLKYLYQHGIAEWGADETYYKSSVVKGSDGNIYGSKIDDNVGHNPVGDIANWEQLNGSGFDFEGTKAEFDAAVSEGTITADSVSLITDDVDGANVATKAELQAVDSSKADTSLSNTTPSQSFKEMSVGWGFPDYSTGVQISGSSYTATYKCWLIGTTLASTLTAQTLYVNGHMVGKEEGDYIDVQMPIDVGDVVTVSGGSFNKLFVYAIKGAN